MNGLDKVTKRLSVHERRLLLRLWKDAGEYVPSTELYKAMKDDRGATLDPWNPHVRVVIHDLRKKLAGSGVVVFSRPHGGYGVRV